jgi:acetate kinase
LAAALLADGETGSPLSRDHQPHSTPGQAAVNQVQAGRGLSGISNDMRVLETGDEPGAKLAIDYFVYRIGLYAGMLAAALGGLDAFVFTAGIGENSTKHDL